MLLWLSGTENNKYSPNENYGREVMELFTLGADRGYTQHDVHQQARALTGFTNTGASAAGPTNFRFDPELHDDGVKTIFGQRGRFNCARHVPAVRRPTRTHPSFMVAKLWGYFVADPIPGRRAARAGAHLRPQRLRDPPAGGGDPPPPAVLRGRSAW